MIKEGSIVEVKTQMGAYVGEILANDGSNAWITLTKICKCVYSGQGEKMRVGLQPIKVDLIFCGNMIIMELKSDRLVSGEPVDPYYALYKQTVSPIVTPVKNIFPIHDKMS